MTCLSRFFLVCWLMLVVSFFIPFRFSSWQLFEAKDAPLCSEDSSKASGAHGVLLFTACLGRGRTGAKACWVWKFGIKRKEWTLFAWFCSVFHRFFTLLWDLELPLRSGSVAFLLLLFFNWCINHLAIVLAWKKVWIGADSAVPEWKLSTKKYQLQIWNRREDNRWR